MFARFVESGYQLLMTANINTSRLLRELATRCGTKTECTLERMTEWTTLSTVQASAQHLFREAFDQIEADLSKRGSLKATQLRIEAAFDCLTIDLAATRH